MAQMVELIQLAGGLDYSTAPLFVKPGSCIFAQNYVCDFNGGYRRPGGYERFDGQDRPSDSTVSATIAARRALIAVPTGSGQIRGVAFYNGTVYCWRDNAGGTATVMYKSTSSGWSALSFQSYIPFNAGTAAIADGASITDATTKTATVSRVFYYGTWGGAGAAAATGRLYISASSGAWTTGDDIRVGGVSKATATGGVTAQTLSPAGSYKTVQYNFYGASDRFRLYGVDGVNKAFEFDGTNFYQIVTGMTTDVPTQIAAHKNYLFLAFDGGSLQFSSVGAPSTWSVVTGSSEVGLGADCTGLISTKDVLAIYGRNKISILYGTPGGSDYVLKPFTLDGGAITNTIQSMGSDVLAFDDNGVALLSAVQDYGDFGSASISNKVKPLINSQMPDEPYCSVVSKRYGMYMIFWQDKTALVGTFVGNKLVGWGSTKYDAQFVCATSGEDTDGTERIFVGATNGYVYELERGISADGADIEAILRLPFGHLGSPSRNKRLHRVELESNTTRDISIRIKQDLDYGNQSGATAQTITVAGAGSYWGVGVWGTFTWGNGVVGQATVYMDGVGNNIGFLINHTDDEASEYTISAIHIYYSLRGQKRG